MSDDAGITISISEQQRGDVERATAMLARELAREGVPLTPSTGAAPAGAKSGIVLAGGSLVVSGALSTVAVRAAVQVILAFIRRGVVGEITVKDRDRKLTINNASSETERILVDWWLKQGTNVTDEED